VTSSPPPTRGPRRPRPPVAVAPMAISTENVLAIGGLTPRKFREALAAHPTVERSKFGHTLIVTPAAFAELLERLRVTEGDDAADGEQDQGEDDDDQPTSVDDVLAKLGKERIA
jgi:hypothetical protein